MTAQELANQTSGLATISPATLRLVSLLGQPGAANEDIVESIRLDALLTAKLLRSCNSPSLGLAEPICSVDQAVLLLGYSQILRMVLALGVGEALEAALPGYAVESSELWRHSVTVAIAAELLSHRHPDVGISPDVAFTSGLLHDIGKIAMNQVLTPERQAAIRYRIAEHGSSRVEAEREVLGTDHAEVGAALLSLWCVPSNLVEGVAYHHGPFSKKQGLLPRLVFIANCLAHLVGSAPGWEAYALKAQSDEMAVFHLTAESVESLIVELYDQCEQAHSLMTK